jgi:hypothetical protein
MEISNKITLWKNLKQTTEPEFISLETWLDLIKDTPEPHLSTIVKARTYPKSSSSYNDLKKTLPVSQLNGCFPERKIASCISLTGYAYLDIDGCDMDSVRTILKQSPYVYSFWRSVSNTGYGILVKYESNPDLDFNLMLSEIAQEIGIELDKNAKGLNRTNFLSSDPDLYINLNVRPYVTKKHLVGIINKEDSIYTNYMFSRNGLQSPDLVFELYLDAYPQPVVFESRPFFKAFWPWSSKSQPKKVTKGDRNLYMTCFINNLRLLNPDKKKAVETLAYSYNTNYCVPALSSADVKKMIEYSYSRTDLEPIWVRTKKIWVDPAYKGNKNKLIGQAKKLRSVNKIEDYLSEAFCKQEKITVKKIVEATDLSMSTVNLYLVHYKDEIKEFNKFIMETRPKIPRSRVKNLSLV